jgi:hypothetical protein
MKFDLYARHRGSTDEPWVEHYDEELVTDLASAEKMGRAFIEFFNSTFHPGERPREFVRVELPKQEKLAHQWSKQNLFTQTWRGRPFDIVRCEVCGITGKRWGLSEPVLDRKYRALFYRYCDTAKAHLEKLKERKAINAD